jgi:SAM-dependent methyltransferase
MQGFGQLVHCAAQNLRGRGLLSRFSNLCYGVLPVLLPSPELIQLVRSYYRQSSVRQLPLAHSISIQRPSLDPWESKVCETYAIRSGRALVLGSGYGRESIAIAEMGTRVVGVDAEKVVWAASRASQSMRGKPIFVQADFLQLPFTPGTFDFILISNSMYSSVQGLLLRQRWLESLRTLLTADGLLVISFISEWHRTFSTKTICFGLNALLARLPGANPHYQPGDEAFDGHFLHAFQSESELRQELTGAGAFIREIDWRENYAVVTFSIAHVTPDGSDACSRPVLNDSLVGANR